MNLQFHSQEDITVEQFSYAHVLKMQIASLFLANNVLLHIIIIAILQILIPFTKLLMCNKNNVYVQVPNSNL